MAKRGQSRDFLRKLRKKYGLGEFRKRKKSASRSRARARKRPRARERARARASSNPRNSAALVRPGGSFGLSTAGASSPGAAAAARGFDVPYNAGNVNAPTPANQGVNTLLNQNFDLGLTVIRKFPAGRTSAGVGTILNWLNPFA